MTKKDLATLKAAKIKTGLEAQLDTFCSIDSKIRFYTAHNKTLDPKKEADKKLIDRNNADIDALEKDKVQSLLYIDVLNTMLEEVEKEAS